MCEETSNNKLLSNKFKIEDNYGRLISVFYLNQKLNRIKEGFNVFEISEDIKKNLEKYFDININCDIVLKINYPIMPFDLKDHSFYHKHYTPYLITDNEIEKAALRQWKCQEIANKLDLAPKIILKDINGGIIYTLMEKIPYSNINIISGNGNLEFAKSKKYEIINSLQKLHDNDVIHGDILTDSSYYTNNFHNIYYDSEKGIGFIDFGDSRFKDEVLNNDNEIDFNSWKKIEMELVEEKLFKEVDKKKYEEYVNFNNILKKNFEGNCY